jgi:hypothetical protein
VRRGTIHPRGLSFLHGVICGGSRPPSVHALLQFLRPGMPSTSIRVPACALFRCYGGVLLLCSVLLLGSSVVSIFAWCPVLCWVIGLRLLLGTLFCRVVLDLLVLCFLLLGTLFCR